MTSFIMKDHLIICTILSILYVGLVSSQNCYTCSYVDGAVVDACTDANFDTSSDFILESACSGECFISETEFSGITSFTRGCGAGVCDLGSLLAGVTCCSGDLCNVPGGSSDDNGDDSSSSDNANGDDGVGGGDSSTVCYSCIDSAGYGCDIEHFDRREASTVTCAGACTTYWGSDEHDESGVGYSYRGCALDDMGNQVADCTNQACASHLVECSSRCCDDGNLCNDLTDFISSITSSSDNGGSEWNGVGGGDSSTVCYSCIDSTGYGCDNDNFDRREASTVTCAGACVNYWGSDEHDESGVGFSYRGCAQDDMGNQVADCIYQACASHLVVCTSRCCDDGNLCNDATGLTAASQAFILSTCAVVGVLIAFVY